MSDIRVPTFDELLSRIEDWPSMSGPQLAAAMGAEEAMDVLRQFREQITKEEAGPTTK